MAIPNNYIDKITNKDTGESRIISPAADKVRVENENFEGADLDEVLDEVAQAIEDAGSGDGTVTGVKVGSTTYEPTDGVVDISPAIPDTSGLATKTEVNAGLAEKVDKVTGYGLSKNDYTDADKTKLAGIEPGAEVNVINGIKANGASETLPVDQNGIVTLPPAGSTISPATAAPLEDGTAGVGSSDKYAREDHVHPHDTSKLSRSDVSVETQGYGTVDINVKDDKYTINLNHTHEGMAKLVVDTAANLPDASEMESDTIYGELDDGEIATIYLGGYPFYGGGGGASSGPVLRRPADGSTIDMGETVNGSVSKTINVKGKNLTQALTIELDGTGYAFGNTQPSGVTIVSTTELTVTAEAANALNGVDIVVVYTGNADNADASFGITSGSPDNISCEATLVANIAVYEDLAGVKLTGTQWLQTDYKPTASTQFVMKVKFTDNDNSNIVYGSDVGTRILYCPQNNEAGGSEKFVLYQGSNVIDNNKVYKGCYSLLFVNKSGVSDAGALQQIKYSDTGSELALFLTDESIIKFENITENDNGGKLSFLPGGNTGKNVTTSHKWYRMQSPMRIGIDLNDKIYSVFDLTIYELTFTENDTNKNRHYIPKSRNGVPGLYETNTGAFISSETNDDLVPIPLTTNNN